MVGFGDDVVIAAEESELLFVIMYSKVLITVEETVETGMLMLEGLDGGLPVVNDVLILIL